MAAKKAQQNSTPAMVDMNTLAADTAGDGALIDVDALPTPKETFEDIFPEAVHAKAIEAGAEQLTAEQVYALEKAEVKVIPPEEDGYCNVMYHLVTKKYLPFNTQLLGRSDVLVQRVPKERYKELMVKMGFA